MSHRSRKYSDDFLSRKERRIYEEMQFIQDVYIKSEAIFANWETWIMAIQGVLIVAVIYSGGTNPTLFQTIAGVVGFLLSISFYIIQHTNSILSSARVTRQRELEIMLSGTFTISPADLLESSETHSRKHIGNFFQLYKMQDAFRSKDWLLKMKIPFTKKNFSWSWTARQFIACLFIGLWFIWMCITLI